MDYELPNSSEVPVLKSALQELKVLRTGSSISSENRTCVCSSQNSMGEFLLYCIRDMGQGFIDAENGRAFCKGISADILISQT